MQFKPDRLTFLIILFFGLVCILFTVVLIKRNDIFSRFSNQTMGDYIVYQQDKQDFSCPQKQVCEQYTKVYRSGKILALGQRMINDIYSQQEIEKIMNVIKQSKIMTKECSASEDSTTNSSYIVKYGIQVRRLEFPECKNEVAEIEAALFGTR